MQELTSQDLSLSPLENPPSQGQPELSFADRVRLYAHRLPSVLRSALGHLRLRFPKDSSCGPSLGRGADQRLSPNTRTLARFEGIQALSARFPWVDKTDCNMFLFGFDAGERWALRTRDNAERDESCRDL